MVGCNGSPTAKLPPERYFPVQKEVPDSVFTALWPGKLEMDDSNCLRVDGTLILWPHGYTYKIEGDAIWIIDDRGAPAVRTGDMVKIGGGGIPEQYVEDLIDPPLPEGCPGPFWLASTVTKDSSN